jgi:Egh16-like virulence factor
MQFSTVTLLIAVLVGSDLVAAHGKVAVATGDAGGNGTALGIQGGVIPGAGPNKKTEPDTTVFKGENADACGQTKGVSSSTHILIEPVPLTSMS